MTPRYGIDTSILVRLLTGDPRREFERISKRLIALVEQDPSTVIVASNQVIGEAYVAVRHHYGVSKGAARNALISVLTSGLVAPLGGPDVLEHIRAASGCGLLDRLIHVEYASRDIATLTLDRRMARLEGAARI